MKKIAILAGAVAVIAALSCDPIGTEDTKVWITGYVYADSAMTTPQEGVVMMLEVDPDSVNVSSSDVMTSANGLFMMEVQAYPDLPDEEGTTGYTMPAMIEVGLSAHYGSWTYTYRTAEDPFIIAIGDTLYVWPIGGAN